MTNYYLKVSIIILNWNQWDITAQCLNSLRQLDYQNFNIILVDNASDMPIPQNIVSIPNIVFLRNNSNLGFGRGNNIGIRYALNNNAEYIWLLNNDTIVLENTLSELKALMDKKPKVGMAGSAIYNMGNRNKLQTYGGYKLNIPRCYVVPCKTGENPDYVSGASMFIRKQALLDAGLFDEKFFLYWEDVDLNLRIKEKGWEIAVADNSTIYHTEGASSSSFKKEYHSFISGIYFSWKHSHCFIYTLIIGFLYDRIIKRLLLLLINPLITRT